MNALLLTLFVSFVLVVLGLLAFGFSFRQRDHDYSDRLSHLPFDDGDAMATASSRSNSQDHNDASGRRAP